MACLGAAPWSRAATGVMKIRFGGDQTQTRIVIDLDQSTHGRLLVGGQGGRIVLALPGLDASAGLDGEGRGLVRSWSVDRVAGAARVEFGLTRGAVIKRRFLLAPSDGSPNYRYVLDIVGVGPAAPTSTAALLKVNHVADVLPIHARKVVVIDAGHGGKDPGASGAEGVEKDVTLAAAKALKKRLERDGRYVVVLTRTRDVFVPLEERVRIARNAEADLFISLHADAGSDGETRGATVYTLSDKGSDRVARNVIGKDNWFINVSLPGHDRAVDQILLDLTQRATRNQSSAFAETLIEHISDETPMLQHGHRDAGYMVLLAPDVPAVLLEMGFITNQQDEAGLRSPVHRTRMMDSVGDAIDSYFNEQRRYASR
ncbi:MAG: N-acetylmuramoyl-L-alanine amidase [Caulobacteraceae bacterium]